MDREALRTATLEKMERETIQAEKEFSDREEAKKRLALGFALPLSPSGKAIDLTMDDKEQVIDNGAGVGF